MVNPAKASIVKGQPPWRMELIEGPDYVFLQRQMDSGKIPVVDGSEEYFLKPQFLFGDKVVSTDDKILKLKEEWHFEANNIKIHIPKIDRQLPLSAFTCLASKRRMNWKLTPTQGRMLTGHLTAKSSTPQRDIFRYARDRPSYSLRV